MSSRLQYAPRDYALVWFEDGEEGATVGQEFYPSKGRSKLAIQQTTNALAERLAKKIDNKEGAEFLTVEIAVAKFVLSLESDQYDLVRGGFSFESRELVKRAMGEAKAALKALKEGGDPWPEWARIALANGWRPPKGWKP